MRVVTYSFCISLLFPPKSQVESKNPQKATKKKIKNGKGKGHSRRSRCGDPSSTLTKPPSSPPFSTLESLDASFRLHFAPDSRCPMATLEATRQRTTDNGQRQRLRRQRKGNRSHQGTEGNSARQCHSISMPRSRVTRGPARHRSSCV